ncbi:MAG: MFS transporter [Kiritimatiellae bacterium]|nr:MFS transporter [Kiritimatiellia bacterium]
MRAFYQKFGRLGRRLAERECKFGANSIPIQDEFWYNVRVDKVNESCACGVRFLLAVAGLGGFLYGIDFGVIAAASPYIRALRLFTDAELSWVVGAVLFGGIVSSLTAGALAERFGRRRMIVASAALFLAAVPVVCLSERSLAMMLLGRVLQGMSAGYMSVVMPMYLTETLPPGVRGRGTGVFQFCLGLGLVAAAATGFAVARLYGASDAPADVVSDAAKSAAWKVNFWWTLAPVALLFAGALRLPESPVWAKREVRRQETPLSDRPPLLRRRYVVPFLLAVAVLTLNKTTGMSSITSYSVMIFHRAGFAGSLGNAGDFSIKLTNLVVTLVAAALVDRLGRTWLLKVGTAGMTVGLAAIGGVLLAIERFGVAATPTTGLVCLAAFFVMQVFYSLGPGICVWLVLSELMPSRIRANGMAIALFMNQLVAWGLASSFLPWVNAWGWASMFFFFAANGVAYFAVALFIPETKGKSLDELERLFDPTPNPKTHEP